MPFIPAPVSLDNCAADPGQLRQHYGQCRGVAVSNGAVSSGADATVARVNP